VNRREGVPIPARRLSELHYPAVVHREVFQPRDALDAKGLLRIDASLGLERKQRRVPRLAEFMSE
jgi:hypothetical protein